MFLWRAKSFLSYFERHFKEELGLMRSLGVHPRSDKCHYFDSYNQASFEENVSNIGEHCLAVATCAAVISFILREKSLLNNEEVVECTRRALLHDVLKPYDIFIAKALKRGIITKEEYYNQEIFERVPAELVARGISLSYARSLLLDYGSETNIRECFSFFLEQAVPPGDLRLKPGLLVKKIVNISDSITASPSFRTYRTDPTKFLTPAERFIETDSDARYPWALTAGIARTKEGIVRHYPDITKLDSQQEPLFHVHDGLTWLTEEICKELCSLLGQSLAGSSSAWPASATLVQMVNHHLGESLNEIFQLE